MTSLGMDRVRPSFGRRSDPLKGSPAGGRDPRRFDYAQQKQETLCTALAIGSDRPTWSDS
ncbi:hypothetical protein MPL3356_10029 [Mesorhizobium plurifarium]|uniref:Uncharacterized protein n=1 Tax=Mesorhizobium plurifarium TaxID=69974 RepID=A0A090DEF1_MESPL|nr:hypothetical protein MPL3356_10029 [Mesorhizobium plurifarium]